MNGALTTGSQFACLSAGRAGLDDQIKRAVRIGEELVAVAEGLAIKLIKVGPRITADFKARCVGASTLPNSLLG